MILKKIRKDKKGVSPVIGVILMVAATIVIAAVVIAMLGGFSAPKQAYLVAATASQNAAGDVVATFHGGPDAALVAGLNLSIASAGGIVYNDGDALLSDSPDWSSGDVGASATFYKSSCDGLSATAGDDHVAVAATFNDGSAQVILDTWI